MIVNNQGQAKNVFRDREILLTHNTDHKETSSNKFSDDRLLIK